MGKHCALLSLETTVLCGKRNFEPSRRICPFLRNFCVFTEFCGIRYWMVIRGQIRHMLVEFLGHRTVCIHDFTMKYMTATQALTGGILKILS